MNHSFLVHVSKKIPRSQLNRGLAVLNGSNKVSPQRSFSTQPCVTLWGSGARSLGLGQKGSSVFIALQPIRSAAALRRHVSTISMQLRERDPNDDSAAGSFLGESNGAAGNHGENNNGDGGDDKSGRSGFNVIDNQLQKPTVPEVYPQVLAVPIARRPLFPGFYKAVVVKDPNVTAAIKDLLKRGQPYVGAFLLKDENVDVDTITSLDQVHKVGVFAQITSVFPANGSKNNKEEDGGLTAVLYPHRRIEITGLINTQGKKSLEASVENVKEGLEAHEGGGALKEENKITEAEDKEHRAIVDGELELHILCVYPSSYSYVCYIQSLQWKDKKQAARLSTQRRSWQRSIQCRLSTSKTWLICRTKGRIQLFAL